MVDVRSEEVDSTERVILDRLASFDEDAKAAVDAREALCRLPQSESRFLRHALTAVRLTRAATADIAKAADWYDLIPGGGLGDQFLDRVTEAVDSIGGHPKAYRKVIRERAPGKPATVSLRIVVSAENDAVVVACLHAA